MANDEENKQPIESSETEQNSTESKTDEQVDNSVKNQENTQEQIEKDTLLDDSENLTQKKAKKLNKVLVIVVGVLVGILLIGLILFFSGVFDSEEETTQATANASSEQQTTTQTVDGANQAQPTEGAIPAYEFKNSDINVARLNKKLQALVDAPINTPEENNSEESTIVVPQNIENNTVADGTFFDEELEALLPKEEQTIIAKTEQTKEPIIEEQNGELKKEIQATNIETQLENEPKKEETLETKTTEKEKSIVEQKESSPIAKVETKEPSTDTKPQKNIKHPTETKKDDTKNSHFLKFIQVATLKYQLYTQFLREIKAVDARISICQNDNGRIQIFIGPFLDDKQRSFVIEQINKSVVNDAFGLEFTQEEYFRRCGIKDPS